MIDRPARDRAAQLLRQLLSGRLTNDQFERAYAKLHRSKDPAIPAIYEKAWCLYSDLFEHRLVGKHKIKGPLRRHMVRAVLFLHSDDEFEDRWSPKAIKRLADYPKSGLDLRIPPAFLFAGFVAFLLSGMLFESVFLPAGDSMFVAVFHSVLMFMPLTLMLGIVFSGLERLIFKDQRDPDLDEARDAIYANWPFPDEERYKAALRRPRLLAARPSTGG